MLHRALPRQFSGRYYPVHTRRSEQPLLRPRPHEPVAVNVISTHACAAFAAQRPPVSRTVGRCGRNSSSGAPRLARSGLLQCSSDRGKKPGVPSLLPVPPAANDCSPPSQCHVASQPVSFNEARIDVCWLTGDNAGSLWTFQCSGARSKLVVCVPGVSPPVFELLPRSGAVPARTNAAHNRLDVLLSTVQNNLGPIAHSFVSPKLALLCSFSFKHAVGLALLILLLWDLFCGIGWLTSTIPPESETEEHPLSASLCDSPRVRLSNFHCFVPSITCGANIDDIFKAVLPNLLLRHQLNHFRHFIHNVWS